MQASGLERDDLRAAPQRQLMLQMRTIHERPRRLHEAAVPKGPFRHHHRHRLRRRQMRHRLKPLADATKRLAYDLHPGRAPLPGQHRLRGHHRRSEELDRLEAEGHRLKHRRRLMGHRQQLGEARLLHGERRGDRGRQPRERASDCSGHGRPLRGALLRRTRAPAPALLVLVVAEAAIVAVHAPASREEAARPACPCRVANRAP
mmetsp:Transcript_92957/g.236465  ORF Transcript_92957/g.236465 Transcript_92957/m.236465 type:complete len:204 (+) Transcript_92957:500-1111(+)